MLSRSWSSARSSSSATPSRSRSSPCSRTTSRRPRASRKSIYTLLTSGCVDDHGARGRGVLPAGAVCRPRVMVRQRRMAVLAQRQPGRPLADLTHPCGAWARRTNILYPIYKLLLSTRCIVPVRRYAPPLNAWVHVILSLIHVMSSSMRGSASQLCEGKSFLRYFCSKLMDL